MNTSLKMLYLKFHTVIFRSISSAMMEDFRYCFEEEKEFGYNS